MKLLLDTHSFLWLLEEPERLSEKALAACKDPDHSLFLSTASLWEIQIERQTGKLKLKDPLDQIVQDRFSVGPFQWLPILASHVLNLSELPLIHHDPFDRIIMAQARCEGMRLVSSDGLMQKYSASVDLLW